MAYKTPTVSVAMIVMNEEDLLDFCFKSLQSLVPLLDIVSIVDSGSTDRTLEIIEQWQTRLPMALTQCGMPDSFAVQRNRALDRCRGDWILHMDADETFTNNLGLLLEDGYFDSNDVWDFPKWYTILDELHYWIPSGNGLCTRLFKNIGFRYERDIHEYIVYPGTTGWDSIHRPGVIGITQQVNFFDHTHLKSDRGIFDKGDRYQRFKEKSAAAGIPMGGSDMYLTGHKEMLQQPEKIGELRIPKSLIVRR